MAHVVDERPLFPGRWGQIHHAGIHRAGEERTGQISPVAEEAKEGRHSAVRRAEGEEEAAVAAEDLPAPVLGDGGGDSQVPRLRRKAEQDAPQGVVGQVRAATPPAAAAAAAPARRRQHRQRQHSRPW